MLLVNFLAFGIFVNKLSSCDNSTNNKAECPYVIEYVCLLAVFRLPYSLPHM